MIRGKKNWNAFVAAAGVLLMLEGSAHAAPFGLTYGGRFTGSTGSPVAGPVNLEVLFFRAPTGGTPIVAVPLNFNAITLIDGVFQINFSSMSPSDYHLVFSGNEDTWIEVKDTTRNITMPRQNYGAVPYALKVPVDNSTVTFNAFGELTVIGGSQASSGSNSDITALTGLTTAITVSQGGTGATSASAARSNLGAAASGSNSDISALSGLTTALSLAQGGTGATSASSGRSALGAAASGANTDITSLGGLTTSIPVNKGGTGAADAASARTNLGLGTASTLNAGVSGNQLVQLNAIGMLPVVNGSQLTNINAANISGVLPAISGENLTNLAAAQLVGALPAVSGANVTNINADNITSGAVALSRLESATDGDILYYKNGWQRLPVGKPGETLVLTTDNIPMWTLSGPDTSYTKRRMSWLKTPGATTGVAVGMALPTVAATFTNSDEATAGPYLNSATAATSGAISGLISAAFTIVRPAWEPEYITTIKTDPLNTSLRYWIGFFSANIDSLATPTSQQVAAFRYDTGTDGTAFWRTVTNDGSGPATVIATNVAIDPASFYKMRISCGTVDCKFYIDDVLVSVHTTTIPTPTAQLGYGNRVITLLAAARNIKTGRIEILHK